MMALPSLSHVFIFSLAFFFIPLSHSIPFILLHGVNNECSGRVTEFTQKLANMAGVRGYCIEVGDGKLDSWLKPLHEQAQIVCDKVKEMKELSGGYNIVGQSQGNMVARGVIEFCEGGPPVKNYVSLAGPHAGIAEIPRCGSEDFCILINELIQKGVYSDFIQEHLAPSGYIKLPDAIPDYLEKSRYLPELNNELPDKRNSTYKQRFTSLEKLLLVMFENDTILIPKETSWFGYYADGSYNPALPPQQTKLYTEDWIGLKTLDEAGKVQFVSVSGEHLRISDNDLQKYVVPVLKNQASTKNRKAKANIKS